MPRQAEQLRAIFDRLYAHFGPQGWWPGNSAFEVVVGAILTQNTNWKNVERAIANLKEAGLLAFSAMLALPPDLLAEYIRPAGYYRIKAQCLQNLLHMVAEEYGSLEDFLALPVGPLRERLLQVRGIGPETADAITLYAAEKPVFVVDAYTFRILLRHNLVDEDADYAGMQELFMDSLPPDTKLYGEYHALLVQLGKQFCKKTKPDCEHCPLRGL